jgi:hypothetical protein
VYYVATPCADFIQKLWSANTILPIPVIIPETTLLLPSGTYVQSFRSIAPAVMKRALLWTTTTDGTWLPAGEPKMIHFWKLSIYFGIFRTIATHVQMYVQNLVVEQHLMYRLFMVDSTGHNLLTHVKSDLHLLVSGWKGKTKCTYYYMYVPFCQLIFIHISLQITHRHRVIFFLEGLDRSYNWFWPSK